MRKTAAVVGAVIGAFLLPGAAWAGVTVSPGTVQPGGTVLIRACNPNVIGHADVTGPSASAQYDVILDAGPNGAGASFTVPTGPGSLGSWKVVAQCGGTDAGTATFTVSPGGTTGPATGDGGQTSNTSLIATGAGLIAVSVAGYGFASFRRRRAESARN